MRAASVDEFLPTAIVLSGHAPVQQPVRSKHASVSLFRCTKDDITRSRAVWMQSGAWQLSLEEVTYTINQEVLVLLSSARIMPRSNFV
jgi:hypothetical protein